MAWPECHRVIIIIELSPDSLIATAKSLTYSHCWARMQVELLSDNRVAVRREEICNCTLRIGARLAGIVLLLSWPQISAIHALGLGKQQELSG